MSPTPRPHLVSWLQGAFSVLGECFCSSSLLWLVGPGVGVGWGDSGSSSDVPTAVSHLNPGAGVPGRTPGLLVEMVAPVALAGLFVTEL